LTTDRIGGESIRRGAGQAAANRPDRSKDNPAHVGDGGFGSLELRPAIREH